MRFSVVAVVRRARTVHLALLAADLVPALVVIIHQWLTVSGELTPHTPAIVGWRPLALPEGDDVVAAHIALVVIVVPVPVQRVAGSSKAVKLRRRGHSGRF